MLAPSLKVPHSRRLVPVDAVVERTSVHISLRLAAPLVREYATKCTSMTAVCLYARFFLAVLTYVSHTTSTDAIPAGAGACRGLSGLDTPPFVVVESACWWRRKCYQIPPYALAVLIRAVLAGCMDVYQSQDEH